MSRLTAANGGRKKSMTLWSSTLTGRPDVTDILSTEDFTIRECMINFDLANPAAFVNTIFKN